MIRPGFAVAALLAALSAAAARAAPPPLIPREILFGNPERTLPRISPDGKRISWLAPDEKNVLQVWVRGETGDAKQVTHDPKRGIRAHLFAHDNRTLLYLQDHEGDENFHVFGVDLASGNVRDLTPFEGVRAEMVETSPVKPDELLIGLNLRDRQVMDVHRIDLTTGAVVLDTVNPGDVEHWTADPQLVIRAAVARLEDGSSEVRVREGAGAPWRVLKHVGPDDVVYPHSASGNQVVLETDQGRDTSALVQVDLASGAEKELARSPEVDVGEVLVDPRTKLIQAVSFEPARRRWQVLDPSIDADFKGLAKLAEGDFVVQSRDDADQKWLVVYTSDRTSLHWYVWDRAQKRGVLLFSSQPKLDHLELARMEPIELKARDGLLLHGYLTLPPGVKPQKLPLVLLVHGGPWGRDLWGYNSWAQWLANRGYAVVQINFRASAGYGKKFLNAGNKQWGRAMHTDLLDTLDWEVKKGLADPARVAVVGGSYGGYAALASVAFTPKTFACAVDIVGPSNLRTLMQSIPPYWKTVRRQFNLRMGNPDAPADAQLLHDASPLFKADQIVRPLLIGQGANDPRVNVRESEQIVEAIAKNGGSVTYVLYPDEGHGFRRPENSTDFNARAEKFLGGCLGGRVEPLVGERLPGSTAVVRVVGK